MKTPIREAWSNYLADVSLMKITVVTTYRPHYLQYMCGVILTVVDVSLMTWHNNDSDDGGNDDDAGNNNDGDDDNDDTAS